VIFVALEILDRLRTLQGDDRRARGLCDKPARCRIFSNVVRKFVPARLRFDGVRMREESGDPGRSLRACGE